ncbi:MAG TPA: ATP-binding protein [Chitinophagaceae bacterium]|nr:ATP-binding protein [Chitinophagaceae bacterium]
MDAQEAKFYLAVLAVAIVTGIIILYFMLSFVRQHRRYVRLQKERIYAEIVTLERERRRIASDLHDDIGPMLSSIKLNITCLDTELPQDLEIISKAGSYIDETIGSLRTISNNLMPGTLLRKGLEEAIREFTGKMGGPAGLAILIEYAPGLSLGRDREVNLFRIIQEIVHNTIKHARATRLDIHVYAENEQLILATRDNGQGFEGGMYSRKGAGLGLKNLESRTEIMGGRVLMHSVPGKGTQFYFEIPLE